MRTLGAESGEPGSMCKTACLRDTSFPVRQTSEASSRPIVS